MVEKSAVPLNGVELPGGGAGPGALEDGGEFIRDNAPVATITVMCNVVTRLDDGRDRQDQRVPRLNALFEPIGHVLLVLIEAI
jgi:hypothetical protein